MELQTTNQRVRINLAQTAKGLVKFDWRPGYIPRPLGRFLFWNKSAGYIPGNIINFLSNEDTPLLAAGFFI
jgi:hypothetical protein